MSESSNSIAKRRARDGVLYTCAQFEAHYGKRLGRKHWREANVDGSGASEHNSDDGTNTAQANVEGSGWHWWNEPNQAAVNVVQEKDAPRDEITGASEHSSEDHPESFASCTEPAQANVEGSGRDWRNEPNQAVAQENDAHRDEGTGASEHCSEGTGASDHAESFATTVVAAFLGRDEVEDVLSQARASHWSLTMLHDEARWVLEKATSTIHANALEQVEVLEDWQHWRAYVCMHPKCFDIIGEGIVSVVAQAVKGTKDPNRGGRPRVDLVLFQEYRSYVRLHPGSRRKNDAQLVFSPPSASWHGATAVNQWTRIWAEHGVFSIGDARVVPQGDRIGRKEAWRILSALGDQTPLDLTDGSCFLWWLWICSFGAKLNQVIQCGLQTAELTEADNETKLLKFGRRDDTVVHVALSYKNVSTHRWKMEISIWLHGMQGRPDL